MALAAHAQGQQAGDALLHEQAVARRGQAGIEHHVRGAHARVAGERHFAPRAEDAQPVARLRRGGRKHEGRLGQPGPARDRLHRGGVQAFGVEHHGEGVAGTGPVGEDIELEIAARGHGGWGPVV